MLERTFEAKIESISEVTAFVDEWLEGLDCGIKAQMQIDVALDELFSNIAHYAYASGTGEATLQLDFDEVSRRVSITFIDGGVPYDPLQKADPDLDVPIEERAIGGLGIFLVKKTMDGMDYVRRDDRNILTIHKQIQEGTHDTRRQRALAADGEGPEPESLCRGYSHAPGPLQ